MENLPLHVLRVDKVATAINRAHIFFHSFLISLFLYHRLKSLIFTPNDVVSSTNHLPLLPSLLLFLAELILTFIWLSDQASRWKLVDRTVFIQRLPENSKLPAIDVFICTADPDKEPTFEVMNTVVSAMALDYPSDKLHVYLSDDGGSALTLTAMKEAWCFATWWVPFCRRYAVGCSCPMAYFDDDTSPTVDTSSSDFVKDRLILKEKYELFKKRVEINVLQYRRRETNKNNRTNHPPLVQVINEDCMDPTTMNPDCDHDIPLLVYVAREKRSSYPHHFKAGALNVLLRVSSLLSNSGVVLVLDCDMYCNDPTSAKQAMCFYVDSNISTSLGFVQFPQRFHNLSKHVIYDYDFRWALKILMRGMDGLGAGPFIIGTGFYVNRKALYSEYMKELDQVGLRKVFGPSNEIISVLRQDVNPNETMLGDLSPALLPHAEFVASCSYEEETKWGIGLGFYYYSVAEDNFTSYHLHIRGWKSVYLDPEKASFLGSSTTNLNDMLIQNSRWIAGLAEIGLSRFCPLLYGPSRRSLSLLHRSCYAFMNLYAIDFIPVWCFTVIPQLCLLHDIPIYSEASSSLFSWLPTLILLSSQSKHLYEVLTTGGTTTAWWNELRTWIIKMLTCNAYGCMDAIMKIWGIKNTTFIPTNKVVDEDQAKRYQQGINDFQTSYMFLVPLGTGVILNLVCFVVGLFRMVVVGRRDSIVLQVVLSGFFTVISIPIIEGMIVRKDKGRFPPSATLRSIVVCLVLVLLGPFIILH